jgi:hypothetical protein
MPSLQAMQRRQEALPTSVRDIAWKAQVRHLFLHLRRWPGRWRRSGNPPPILGAGDADLRGGLSCTATWRRFRCLRCGSSGCADFVGFAPGQRAFPRPEVEIAAARRDIDIAYAAGHGIQARGISSVALRAPGSLRLLRVQKNQTSGAVRWSQAGSAGPGFVG